MEHKTLFHKRFSMREITILFYLKYRLERHRGCIVNLLAATLFNHTYFLLYEYIDGKDLFKIVEDEAKNSGIQVIRNRTFYDNRLDKSNRKQYTRLIIGKYTTPTYNSKIEEISDRLIEALAYIHSVGIIHNDIKPENIMIPNDPKILPFFIDFGYAAFIDEKLIYDSGTTEYLHYERKREGRARVASINEDLYAIEKTFLFCGAIDNTVDENGVNIDFKVYKAMYDYYTSNKDQNNNAKKQRISEITAARTAARAAKVAKVAAEKAAAAAKQEEMAEYYRKKLEALKADDAKVATAKQGGRRKTKNKRQKKTRKRTSN